MKFRATRGSCSPRPTKPRNGKTSITPSRCYNQVLEKEPGFFECRKALRDAQFRKAGGGGGLFQKNVERRRFLAAGRQGQDGVGQKSRRGAGHCRADFEQRPEQFRRAPHHRGRRAGAGTAAHGALSYETLVKNSPKDKTLVIEFANALSASGGDTRRGEKILIELLREIAQRRRIEARR